MTLDVMKQDMHNRLMRWRQVIYPWNSEVVCFARALNSGTLKKSVINPAPSGFHCEAWISATAAGRSMCLPHCAWPDVDKLVGTNDEKEGQTQLWDKFMSNSRIMQSTWG